MSEAAAVAHDFIILKATAAVMAARLAVERDELMGDGEESQFEPGGDAGFVEDIREVPLDGLFADGELLGDVLVAAAFDDAGDDFEFARGEAVGLALGHSRGLLHQGVERGDQIDDALAADPVVAGEDGAQGASRGRLRLRP